MVDFFIAMLVFGFIYLQLPSNSPQKTHLFGLMLGNTLCLCGNPTSLHASRLNFCCQAKALGHNRRGGKGFQKKNCCPTRMSRWKLGSMVSKWGYNLLINGVYWGEITHFLRMVINRVSVRQGMIIQVATFRRLNRGGRASAALLAKDLDLKFFTSCSECRIRDTLRDQLT